MTALASIAVLIATLNTRGDYLFVDVSAIDVTGDKQAEAEERVRGEHIARFYEWLAESRWIMQKCGATIPSALSEWTPPKPHEIVSPQGAIEAYRAADGATGRTADVLWIGNLPGGSEYVECFSRNGITTGHSSEYVEDIADAAWRSFSAVIYYSLPLAVAIPDVPSGNSLTSGAINAMNLRSVDPNRRWYAMGSDRLWSVEDPGFTTISFPYQGETYYEGSPLSFSSDFREWSGRNASKLDIEAWDNLNNRFKFPNVVYANCTDPTTPFFATYYVSGTPDLVGSNGAIRGGPGIPIYGRPVIFVFLCCWRAAYNSATDSVMNIRVFAKRYELGGSETIGDLAAGAVSRTPLPSGKQYEATYVAVLFVGHGGVQFLPNASN